MPVKLVMLGVSHSHAHGNMSAAQVVPEVQILGIWDPDGALARQRQVQWTDGHPDLVVFESAEQALSAPGVEGVIVDGPVQENLTFAGLALANGKHVLLEKPAGMNLDEFRNLHALARKHALLIQMGYILRYNAGFVLARRLKEAGALGEVFSVRGRISWSPASYQTQML